MAKNNAGAAIGVGVGVAAAAAAAAGGAYWLYGAKHSAKHRRMAKSWILKARGEVMEAIEKLEDIDKEKYLAIAEEVLARYAGKGISRQEIAAVTKDFSSAWKHINKAGKPAKRGAKRVVRKAKTVGRKAKGRTSRK